MALGVDLQRKISTPGQPAFLARLQCLARLANNLKLIVAEELLKILLYRSQLGRNGRGVLRILGNDQTAPDRLGPSHSSGHAQRHHQEQGEERRPEFHKRYFAAYSAGNDCKPSVQRTVTLCSLASNIVTVALGLTVGSTRAFRIWVRYCDCSAG